MRAVWLIVVCACGGKAAPPGALANVSTEQPATAKPAEVTGDCEPHAGGWEAGSHDRYVFEDPALGRFGYKTKAGAIAIPARYVNAYEFTPGGVGAVVETGAAVVLKFIDVNGKLIAAAYPFDNGPDYFQEGFARIVDARKRMGYIDETGKIVVAPQFDFAAPFCHGKAQVELGNKVWFIDRAGTKTTPPPEGPREYVPSGG